MATKRHTNQFLRDKWAPILLDNNVSPREDAIIIESQEKVLYIPPTDDDKKRANRIAASLLHEDELYDDVKKETNRSAIRYNGDDSAV